MKEVADKAAAAEEAARAKREKKLQKARDEVDKAKAAAAAPSELFRGDAARAAAYSQYDAEGVPTHDKDGEPIAKAQTKKLSAELKKHAKAHEALLAKAAEKGGDAAAYIAALEDELRALELGS
jgi:cysteinyl-tRNA synthetase